MYCGGMRRVLAVELFVCVGRALEICLSVMALGDVNGGARRVMATSVPGACVICRGALPEPCTVVYEWTCNLP